MQSLMALWILSMLIEQLIQYQEIRLQVKEAQKEYHDELSLF